MKISKRLLYTFFTLITVLGFSSCNSLHNGLSNCGGCNNGGECVEGICECADGYDGSNCSTQRIPSTVIIENIEVEKFPKENNGIDWDNLAGPNRKYPDIYIKILFNGQEVFNNVDENISNAQQNEDHVFYTNEGGLYLSKPLEEYVIELWDSDELPSKDELMDKIAFVPNNKSDGFPDKWTIETTSNPSTKFILNIKEYKFL